MKSNRDRISVRFTRKDVIERLLEKYGSLDDLYDVVQELYSTSYGTAVHRNIAPFLLTPFIPVVISSIIAQLVAAVPAVLTGLVGGVAEQIRMPSKREVRTYIEKKQSSEIEETLDLIIERISIPTGYFTDNVLGFKVNICNVPSDPALLWLFSAIWGENTRVGSQNKCDDIERKRQKIADEARLMKQRLFSRRS